MAILADHCHNDEQALNFYQRFKWAVIAELLRIRHGMMNLPELFSEKPAA